MDVFGWIVLVVISVYASFAYIVLCTQTLGSYNIGGVPTTIKGKVLTVALGLSLAWWWVKIIDWSPFTLTAS